MKITDDRGVERVVRAGEARARDAAFAGLLMLLHVLAFTIMPGVVFGLSYFGSRWVLEYFNIGDAAGFGTISLASGTTIAAVVMYARRVGVNRSAVRSEAEVIRCRACRYDLSGLANDSDGCRVCPECGGAWRVKA